MWVGWCLGFAAGFALGAWLFVNLLAAHAQSAEVSYALEHAAAEQGVSLRCLRSIAWRESRYTAWIDNRQGSGAQGLFQFMPGTWRWMSQQAGYAGASPYDPWCAAHVAAWAIRHGYVSHWGGC